MVRINRRKSEICSRLFKNRGYIGKEPTAQGAGKIYFSLSSVILKPDQYVEISGQFENPEDEIVAVEQAMNLQIEKLRKKYQKIKKEAKS